MIPERGLALFVHSIVDYKDPSLFAGDAAAYIKCVFRVIMFRPFPGEVIHAQVRNSTAEGIYGTVFLSFSLWQLALVPSARASLTLRRNSARPPLAQ